MQRQIVLSNSAKNSLNQLFKYLETNWSNNVKLKFISKLENKLKVVRETPEIFAKSEIKAGLRKCVITRQTAMYYTFDEKSIYILTVFDNRQNPQDLEERVK